jgi:rubredoxin
MKCGFCGFDFDPASAEAACGSCPLVKGCSLVRCPHCGYEMPPEAKLVRWLRWLRSLKDRRDKRTAHIRE